MVMDAAGCRNIIIRELGGRCSSSLKGGVHPKTKGGSNIGSNDIGVGPVFACWMLFFLSVKRDTFWGPFSTTF